MESNRFFFVAHMMTCHHLFGVISFLPSEKTQVFSIFGTQASMEEAWAMEISWWFPVSPASFPRVSDTWLSIYVTHLWQMAWYIDTLWQTNMAMEDGPYEDLLHMVKNSIATFGKPECLFTTKVNYKDTSAKTHPQNWCFRIRESSPKNALIIQENVPRSFEEKHMWSDLWRNPCPFWN